MSNILTEADEIYLIEVVTECRVKLRSALTTAQSYGDRLSALTIALESALAGIQQADEVLTQLINTEE